MEDELDLSDCPYLARYYGMPDQDPQAICFQLGVCEAAGEPICMTSGFTPPGLEEEMERRGR